MAHHLAPEAVADLDAIWDYVARASSADVADRLIGSIVERILLLASYPQLGRRRDHDLRAGLRSFPVGEYVIIYRIEGDDVLILHIVHGHRDIEALFDP
jgi:toxin ParE1/3/4